MTVAISQLDTRNLKLLLLFWVALSSSALAVDRNAFTFTNYQLQVQLVPAQHEIAVGGDIMLRNDSATPQKNAVLQISSSLNWISIKLEPGLKSLLYVTHPYTSDIDHTGALSEAVVTLPRPVAPGASVTLEVRYSGQIELDARRLANIGTPRDVALTNDWDQISADFTAVRGVGYVVWYPVAMDSVSLAEGHEYSLALGAWRAREAGAEMRIAAPSEPAFRVNMNDQAGGVHGFEAGCVAASTGKEGTTKQNAQPQPPAGNCFSADTFRFAPIGDRVPLFYSGDYTRLSQGNILVDYASADAPAAHRYAAAGAAIEPFVAGWLASSALPTRSHVIQIVQLPAQNDVAFESGDFLLTPLASTITDSIQLDLAHALAHAYFDSSRPWLYGVAGFMQALTREHQADRQAALDFMAQQLPALAQEEKENQEAETSADQPFSSVATSLASGADEILYRSKAMYVWWMLRDMLGEAVIKNALADYKSTDDKDPAYMQRLLEQAATAEHVAPKFSLEQFFDDWVYRDRGLPDFSVKATYTRELLAAPGGDHYMVTVTIANSGNAGAEVPVTVSAGEHERATKRLAVPARGEASIRIPTVNLPAEVTVDDGSVPESDMKNNSATVAPPSK